MKSWKWLAEMLIPQNVSTLQDKVKHFKCVTIGFLSNTPDMGNQETVSRNGKAQT